MLPPIDLRFRKAMFTTGEALLFGALIIVLLGNTLLSASMNGIATALIYISARRLLADVEEREIFYAKMRNRNALIGDYSKPVNLFLHAPDFHMTHNARITGDQAERILTILGEDGSISLE